MKRQTILWTLVILAFLFSAGIGFRRIMLERSHRTVELALDYESFVDTARAQGWDQFAVLKKLKAGGVTSIALNEDTPEKMQMEGRIRWLLGRDLSINSGDLPERFRRFINRIKPGSILVYVYDEATRNQVLGYLSIFLGAGRVHSWGGGKTSGTIGKSSGFPLDIIEVSTDPRDFSSYGLGFSPSLVKLLGGRGFKIILRPENKKTFTSSSIREYFRSLSRLPDVTTIVFGGQDNEVIGYPNCLDDTIEGLSGMDASLGLVEVPDVRFIQKGSRYLGLRLAGRAVRVQSIGPLQLAKLDSNDVVEKFMLGIRERNIRVAYLRPLAVAEEGKDLLQTNMELVSRLENSLKKQRFVLGRATPLGDFGPHPFSLLILSLGAGALLLLLLEYFIRLPKNFYWFGLGLFILGFAAAWLAGALPLWRKIIALLTAISAPTLAMALHFPYFREAGRSGTVGKFIRRATLLFLRISLISLMGGLIVAALLSSTTFFLQIDQARGIKLVMLLPLLLTAFLFFTRNGEEPGGIRYVLEAPLLLKHLLAILLAVGVGIFYILRTGNAPEGATTDFERLFRAFLDRMLLVRPRLKEFLLGHPILMFASAYSSFGYEGGLWGLLLIGCIGQADILDTFCHLHTPLAVTLLRVFNGLLLGWLAGVVLIYLFFRFTLNRGEKSET